MVVLLYLLLSVELCMGTAKVDDTCACGTPVILPQRSSNNLATRIVGGVEVAQKYKYNWMAQLCTPAWKGQWFCYCGASLISAQYLLTAAHCTCPETFYPTAFKNDTVFVRLGNHNFKDVEVIGQEVYAHVGRVTCHEVYAPTGNSRFQNDIAIIRLNKAIEFWRYGGRVGPICLSQKAFEGQENGKDCTVAGWGLTSENGVSSDFLQEVNLRTMSMAQCLTTGYKDFRQYIGPKMMCAGPTGSATADACQGDSGGPLFRSLSGKYYQIGVVSWGNGCARAQFPGMFTKLSEYYLWLIRNMADDAVICTGG